MKIIGNTVGTPLPKPNFKQTDPTKGDYIKNKPEVINPSVGQFLAIEAIDEDGFITKFKSTEVATDDVLSEAKSYVDAEIDEWIGDKSVATQISNAIEELPQSDWNQNDESASDYIKNRPFYEEISLQHFDITDKFAFTSQTLEGFVFQVGEGTFTLPFIFTTGETYKFTINGTEYEAVCQDVTNIMGEGYVGFGDFNAILNGDIASVNFYAIGSYNPDDPSEFIMQSAIKTESEITEFAIDAVVTNLVKIDKKYLPNSIESINGIIPDGDGAIALTSSDVGAAKVIELTETDGKLSMTYQQIIEEENAGNIVKIIDSNGKVYTRAGEKFINMSYNPDLFNIIITYASVSGLGGVSYKEYTLPNIPAYPGIENSGKVLTATKDGYLLIKPYGRKFFSINKKDGVWESEKTMEEIENSVSSDLYAEIRCYSLDIAPMGGDEYGYIYLKYISAEQPAPDIEASAYIFSGVYGDYLITATIKENGVTVDVVNTKKFATTDDITALVGDTAVSTQISNAVQNLATTTYVDNKVAGLVDSAPETLNTLNELSAALGDDPNFATTIANQIGTKAAASDLAALQGLVGDTAVSTQIETALTEAKTYTDGQQVIKPLPVYEEKYTESIDKLQIIVNVDELDPNVLYQALNDSHKTVLVKYVFVCADGTQKSVVTHNSFYSVYITKNESQGFIKLCFDNAAYKVNYGDKSTAGVVTVENFYNTNYLGANNTYEYVPTSDYNPVTKKYVDDALILKADRVLLEEDAIELLMELDIVNPVSNTDNTLYTNNEGKVYTL